MSRPISEMPAFVKSLIEDLGGVLFDTAMRVKERMAQPGKPRNPSEKVDWDSIAQKRGYFASGGFGAGIPYTPTHKYELSWQAERTSFGAIAHAPHPAGAIGGIPSGWQSRIHRGRRPHLLTVLFEELARIPQEISNKFSVRGRE